MPSRIGNLSVGKLPTMEKAEPLPVQSSMTKRLKTPPTTMLALGMVNVTTSLPLIFVGMRLMGVTLPPASL